MIRLTRRRATELTVTAQAEPLADLRVGKQDLAATGWHNDATGELFPGFGAGPDDMILDVGCGDVPVSAFLAGSGASFVLADILPEAVQRAAESLRGPGPAPSPGSRPIAARYRLRTPASLALWLRRSSSTSKNRRRSWQN